MEFGPIPDFSPIILSERALEHIKSLGENIIPLAQTEIISDIEDPNSAIQTFALQHDGNAHYITSSFQKGNKRFSVSLRAFKRI